MHIDEVLIPWGEWKGNIGKFTLRCILRKVVSKEVTA